MDRRIVSAIQRQRVLRILYDGQWRFFVTQKVLKVLDREYEPVRPDGFDAVYAEPARVGGV